MDQSIIESQMTTDTVPVNDGVAASNEKLRILVVDDEVEIVEEIVELLTDADYECVGANSALDAIDKIHTEAAISVVVTDLKMPGMDGLEMVKTINDTLSPDREIATIVITGNGDASASIKALRLGAMDFITKPILPDYLLHAVGRAVEKVLLRRLDRLFNQRLQKQVVARTEKIQKLSSELQIANQDLQKINQELEIASRVKGEFLSMIGHELRTPLNVIIGYSELMTAKNAEEGKSKDETYNHNVATAGKKLLNIVNSILEMTDIRSGGLQLNKSGIDAGCLIHKVTSSRKDKIEAKTIDLIVERPKSVVFAYGDEAHLVRAIGNVLDNAIQFSNSNGQVGIAVEETGDTIKFTILDTGKGMSEEEIAIALEPFRQVDGSLSKSHYGLGIGLTFSRLIFELHGGRLEIESAPDEGTKVTMSLPVGER